MRIAFISTMAGVPWGGSEALWSETAKKAIAAGHEVLTSTSQWDDAPEAIPELAMLGARTVFRPGYNPSLRVRLYRRAMGVLQTEHAEIRAIKAFAPDIMVISQSSGYDLLEWPHLREFLMHTTVSYCVICHNYNEDRNLTAVGRHLLRTLYGKAKAVYMICDIQAKTIQKQLAWRLPHLRIINNPVNLKRIDPLPMPSVTGAVQFACVGSLHTDRKGQDMLLEVLSGDSWKARTWHLNLYGVGPDYHYIESLIDYFDLAGRVSFHGHMQDIRALWMVNHALLLSSRIETVPMVLTEAMLCARPVIATNVGRVPEWLVDGVNGFVAPAATVALYDAAMERAWQQKDQWSAIGQNAYKIALSVTDQDAAQTFLNLITSRD